MTRRRDAACGEGMPVRPVRIGQKWRHGLWGGLAAVILALSAACEGASPAAPSTPLLSSSTNVAPATPPLAPSLSVTPSVAVLTAQLTVAIAPLAPELVGKWETSHWLDSTGSQQLMAIFQFTPDGRYEYTFAYCRSSTDCEMRAHEWGYAQAADGVLSLSPQTESTEGARAYPYAVGPDPSLAADNELRLRLPDGSDWIFFPG
jgi:hypothetical protein